MKRSVFGVGVLAALCAMPLNSARAAFSNVECQDYYGKASVSGSVNISGNTFNNNANLSVSYNNLSNPNGNKNVAAAVLEWQPNVGYGVGPVTVANGSGGTMRAVNSTPGGWAAGFWSDQIYGDPTKTELTLDNYGTAYGEGQWTGFGLYNYNLYGGAKIANRSGATATGKGSAYAVGINSFCYYGAINFVNDGTVTATASGASSGDTTSYGINLFTYDSDSSAAAPLYCVNNGTVQASITGNGVNHCYGMFVWAQGGKMTLINNGPVTGSGSGNAEGVYCGSNFGDTYVENNSQMVGSGAPGYGLGMEVDSGNAMTLVNRGLIKNDATSGQGQDGIYGGMGLVLWVNAGPTYINNAANATLYGGYMGIWAGVYGGPITIDNYGTIYGGSEAMHLGDGNDKVTLFGSATVTGVMDGGKGNNSLIFSLEGTLQYVNGNAANSGNNLSAYGLGTSGSIVVSGKTYSWRNFNVSGTIISGPSTGTYYFMQNRTSGLVIDSKGSTSVGSQVAQWSKVNSGNLKWRLAASDSGYYYIQNQTTGLYLDGGGATANGSAVKEWNYVSSPNLQWQLVATDSGYFYVKNRATGLYLDGGGATANGSTMKQWSYVSSPNLQWSFQ